MSERQDPVLVVKGLSVDFATDAGLRRALRNVDLHVDKGEILGVVGESGSGKSITARAVLGLLNAPGCRIEGSIRIEGREITTASEEELRQLRGRRAAMIFQDPMNTLNPVLRVDTQMVEAITAHEKVSRKAAMARALDTLVQVGIPAPRERLAAYPHHLSGGMRQRVAIAIALLNRPALIIADEPTTALDVTIQAQILAKIQELVRESDTALMWITHDLSVVAGLADRISVFYAGQVVEEGPVSDVLDRPLHHYTSGLLDSVPSRSQPGQPLRQIPGMMPGIGERAAGCVFKDRCGAATPVCAAEPALYVEPANDAHVARCFWPIGYRATN